MNSGKGMRNKLEVIWSYEAAKSSDQIIKYLLEEWTVKEAFNFLETLKGFEEIVSYLKQISILYSVKRNSILVHTIIDNRQDPKKSSK